MADIATPGGRMHLKVERRGDAALLTIATPRFTCANADTVGAEAAAAIRDDVGTHVVDLSRVTQFDTAALDALIGLLKVVGRHGRLELCAPTPPVRKLLRLSRMDTVFMVHQTLGEALEHRCAAPQRRRARNG